MSIRLRPELEDKLGAMAASLNRSRNWLIIQALEDYLRNQETEQQRWKDTLAALSSVQQGKVVAGETVHRWVKSWGSKKELKPPKV